MEPCIEFFSWQSHFTSHPEFVCLFLVSAWKYLVGFKGRDKSFIKIRKGGTFLYLTAEVQTDRQASRQSDRHHETRQKTGNTQTHWHKLKNNKRERQREDTRRDRLRVFHIRHAQVVACAPPTAPNPPALPSHKQNCVCVSGPSLTEEHKLLTPFPP